MNWKRTILAALVAAPALSLAQAGPPPGAPGGPSGGRGPGMARKWDPATVTTISGTVVSENRVDRGMGHKGVHLLVKSAEGTVAVHLGPDFYVDQQSLKIASGDAVTVKGSRISFEGKDAILAQTVTRGGTTMVLRDEKGVPAWGGPGQGRGGGRGPGMGPGATGPTGQAK